MKRLLPLLAFLAIAATGLIAAGVVWFTNERAERLAFEAVAAEAVNRINTRLGRNLLLTEATAAFVTAQSGRVTPESFETFVDELELDEGSVGFAGLGYAAFADRADRARLSRALRNADDSVTGTWTSYGQEYCACLVLFVGDLSSGALAGFDAYGDPTRRAAIDRAIVDAAPRATVPVQLVGDLVQAQPGFVVYQPVYAENFGIPARPGPPPLPTGFVIGAFRIGALVGSALGIPPLPPVELTVATVGAPDEPLYRHGNAASERRFGPRLAVTHRIQFAGQELLLAFRPSAGFRPSSVRPLTGLLVLSSLLLGLATAALLREQSRARTTAERLAEATRESLAQKDLMLQEMKHRIKNAISRILAIARQTASRADDVQSFTAAFIERLQAMASAQDLLTRSAWQRADLRELISRELHQVFGTDCDAVKLNGPRIEVDERTTQALGLTFHELATNALKYGGSADGRAGISVSWEVLRDTEDLLRIDWCETGGSGVAAPGTVGFGTRLIDANVRHDLRGAVEREFRPEGLFIRLTIPLADGRA